MAVEEEEEVEVEVEGELQQAARPPEEETQNSSERNHPHLTETAKMLTDSYPTFKDTCH